MVTAIRAPPVLVTPSVHYAVLSDVSPKAGIRATMPFANSFLQGWLKKKNEYLSIAASAVAFCIDGSMEPKSLEVTVDDALSQVYKGPNMACVVYPKVMLKLPNGTAIEIRGRTDIPTTRFTEGYHEGALAKNWTAVNMHRNGSDRLEQMTTQLDKLPGTLETYIITAQALSTWEYLRMMERNADKPPCYQGITQEGSALITTIGVRDERLEPYFRLLAEAGDREFWKGLNAKELFLTYFRNAGLDDKMDITGRWKTAPAVAIPDDKPSKFDIISWEPVLYFETQTGRELRFFGVGYDRTAEADLAAMASSYMERFLRARL